MIYAEILAGGKGTRLGKTELPKQFLMMGEKPIIIHTLEQFLMHPSISKVIICCIEEWSNHLENIIKEYSLDSNKIDIVMGGNDRNETIIKGCKHIEATYGLNHEDIIITHDAVRPFINYRIISDNINAAIENDAVDTVVEAHDTIVVSKDKLNLDSIPQRSEMYLGQTPQTFNIKKLLNIYENLTEDEKNVLTDACKMFLLKNQKVVIVKGEYYNFKITNNYDLKLARVVIGRGINND